MQGISMRNRILPGVACIFFAQLAVANESLALPFSQSDDMPMVLSATRLQQSFFDVPAAVTIIDRQMIEQSGVREIPELLRMVPGMVVGYDSSSSAFVSYHGTSADMARRMQVLVDGRSIYQPLLASVDWIGLPLDLGDIERIEIIRGPNAASFGVNSFLAVVNIITRHPADVAGASVSYRRGDDGIEDYQARLAQRTGEVDWRLSLTGRGDDGFTENRVPNGSLYLNDKDVADSKDIESVYGRAVWARNERSSLEMSFGKSTMVNQVQYRSPIFADVPIADLDNRFLSLAWDQELSEEHRLKVIASHSSFSRDEPWRVMVPRVAFQSSLRQLYEQNRTCAFSVVDGGSAGCGAADMPFITTLMTAIGNDPALMNDGLFTGGVFSSEKRTEIDIQDTWVPSANFRAVLGTSYNKAVVDSLTYLNGKVDNSVVGVFANAEWQMAPTWLLNIGGSQQWDQTAGNYFSPRASLNWQFADNQVLRLVYSEAVHTPDILETNANWTVYAKDADFIAPDYSGTFFQTGRSSDFPAAKAETIASREIGYHGRFDPLHLTLDLRVFNDYMTLTEHNLEVEGSEGFQLRAPLSFRQKGAELAVDWRPLAGQRFQLNYAYLNMNRSLGNDNTNFVPKHSGSVGWWQDYQQGWKMGTTYYFYNDLRDADNKIFSIFYDRLDTKLSRSFSLSGRQRVELSAVMQWRLTDDAELRRENGMDSRHRGWVGAEWRY